MIRLLHGSIVAATWMAATLTAIESFASDWPHWRGPKHDGISAETNRTSSWPASAPKQLWQAALGIGFSIVSVSDGRVFTMGNAKDTDTVWCLDALTVSLFPKV